VVLQFTKKIIALFLTVCLLVTSLCVPVGAVSADGIANYKDFSGKVSFKVNGEYQDDDFTVGNGPLSFSGSLYGNADLGNTYGSLTLYPNFTLSAGDSIDLTIIHPERIYSGFYTVGSLTLFLYSAEVNSDGESSLSALSQLSCYPGNAPSSLSSSMLFGYKTVLDHSTTVVSSVYDDSGNRIGFNINGVLLRDLDRVHVTFYSGNTASDDSSSTGTLTVNFPSDDWISLYSSALVSATPDIPDSSVTDAALTIETIHAGDDFMSSAVSVSGLGSTDAIYNFRAYLYENGTPLGHVDSDAFAGPFMYWHITKSSLIPETEYTLEYVLLENGEETSVTASQTFTTIASTDTPTVDDTQTLSLLSAILAAINDQNDRQENEYESIIDVLGMLWLRLRYIEENAAGIYAYVKDLVPSKEEAALKEATKEITKEAADSLYAADGAGRTSFSTSTEALTSSKDMLDTGVSVTDFFGMFGTYGWGNWFSAETRDDLDTVPSVSTFAADDELSTYEKNLQEIQNFIGGG